MFSALVLVQEGAKGLPSSESVVRTLSALVPAAIEGVVRDVALAARRPDDDLARIADHAGCDFLHGREEALVGMGLGALKQSRVLVLRAGRVPEHGFANELADLAAYGSEKCALMLDAPSTLATRLLPRLSRPSGLVAPRGALEGRRADVAALARGLPAPLVFRSRMVGED